VQKGCLGRLQLRGRNGGRLAAGLGTREHGLGRSRATGGNCQRGDPFRDSRLRLAQPAAFEAVPLLLPSRAHDDRDEQHQPRRNGDEGANENDA
jgi:hypothetical protein